MTTQDWLWCADGAALALLLVATVADHRRHKRRDLDAAPWQGLQVAGFAGVLLITTIALRAA